jgi:DNA repair exonuclease SbcCD ATPase subunit
MDNSVLELQRRTDQIDGFYKALKKQEQEFLSEIETSKKEIDLLTKTSALLKHLLNIMIKDEVSKMAGLVTYGLKTVFEDQNLTFTPIIEKKNEKIHIELKTDNDGIMGEYKSFGGSVAVIESFLLRVLFMLKKKFARLMILDETFSAVGVEYIDNTCKLIRELCEKLGMDILLVTHQEKFKDNADNVYIVKKTSTGLVMEKL